MNFQPDNSGWPSRVFASEEMRKSLAGKVGYRQILGGQKFNHSFHRGGGEYVHFFGGLRFFSGF